MPTYHPAYALRNPEAKSSIVQDLLQVRRVLQGVEAAPVPKAYDPTILLEELREDDLGKNHWSGIVGKEKKVRSEQDTFKGHFKKHGWVLAYSRWLGDHVILTKDESVVIPSHMSGVVYTVKELVQVAAMDRTLRDVHNLHYAKKTLTARII